MAQVTNETATTPYWFDGPELPKFPALDSDIRADAVVIGGGITGLTAAYLLATEGRTVALIERNRVVQGDTGHTSAHLTMVTDNSLTTLVDDLGETHARAVWEAGLTAIDRISAIVAQEEIECSFARVPGYVHAATLANTERSRLEKEAATAQGLGFDAAFVDEVPLVGGPGVRFDRQARFHPRKYLAGMVRAAVELGVRIYEKSDAREFSDSPLSVGANGHRITCDHIVMATHNPLTGNDSATGATLFQTKLALYTSYVVAGRVKSGRAPDALFWDTADPYHYLRLAPGEGNDVVILGGGDHKTGQVDDTVKCYERLEDRLRSLVPGVELTHRWSGQVIETPDGLPYIGEAAPHQFVATGYSGNGMTFGTLGALMACDRIAGRANPWAELFDVDRTAIRNGLWEYVKENTSYPYYQIRDRFAGDEAPSLGAIGRGEGQIVELDGQRVAAHRREDGSLVLRSAQCTHMGCVVGWNRAEKTWDCPCHGSRFQPTGEVISGPAESPLPPVDLKKK